MSNPLQFLLGPPFKGVWGTFAYIDETAEVIKKLQDEGRTYSVLAPCPRHELHQAMGEPQSKIPFISLVCGASGIFLGYAIPSWMSMDWVLPVSAKPIVSIPAFTIIGFELMVLLGGLGTAAGVFLLGFAALRKKPLPGSKQFKGYNRFSVDRFGIVVNCEESEAEPVERLMREHSVEEVVREY